MKSDLTNEAPRGPGLKRVTAGIALLLAIGVLASMVLVSNPKAASATTVSFSQCNNRAAGPGGAPLSVTCTVNIVNNITPFGNSSTVTFTRNCTLNPCTGDTVNSSDVVNAVHQCNGSDNVGGSTTICNVNIVNNISVIAPVAPTAITVSQCIGSGGGGGTDMTGCVPSSQGSPTVTQCNGSGDGGGGKMTCNASGTTSSAFLVTVDQCNGSERGGGSFVTCTVNITNNVTETPAAPLATEVAAAATTQAAASATAQAAAPTATQAAAATATQAAAATATTQAAAAAATQAAAATATQATRAAITATPTTPALRVPQSGDAGLLQHTRNGWPTGGIAFAALFLLGALALTRLVLIR
jgi:hypothetical protein